MSHNGFLKRVWETFHRTAPIFQDRHDKISARDRAVSGVLTIFSPLIEGMGLVGDSLRIHREVVAIKAGERVREMLADEKKVNPVPPKFFAPWLEGVSLEDLDDETLINAWASVLARASTHYSPQMPSYLKVLEQLTSIHADLLRDIALMNSLRSQSTRDELQLSSMLIERGVDDCVELLLRHCQGGMSLEEAVESNSNTLLRRGTLIMHVAVDESDGVNVWDQNYVHKNYSPDYSFMPELTVLQSLGLIYRRTVSFSDPNGSPAYVFLHLATLSEYGVGFCSMCIPEVVEALKVERDGVN